MEPWIEILLRSVLIFFLAFFILRILGKRHPVRTTPFYFVTYVVIAILAALISVNMIPIVHGLIALGIWFALPIALDYLSIKSKVVHDIFYGRETILIKQGKILEENLMRVRYSAEELTRELRQKDIFNLADIEFAVMENTGNINVLLKANKKPITAHDMERKVAPETEPETVILDGSIINEGLTSLGLNKEWIKQQLETSGVSLDNVFVGQVDTSGNLYLDLFDDAIEVDQTNVKELVFANLENIHANLMSFYLETENEEAKKMYQKNAQIIEQLINKLRPYLLR
ncbi:hypothetical protein SYNTR_1631 [Candidatus Syntrophocurvum alkaliphilum]|uniref:YetF C-terminal domain-containing protein n=1 Tax=Candidatus Syntrophocurvum alkaliphilum TaxID=2293317 RepID=A0A6I6DLC7_9FIRM|nr:DUF421 domain-containing protein [Candidatus Syntrophocurvum alkaliphilum]QGU00225.1 hypothetical protein SYNTR_1631 [Candidatus Syntrophocurvum alkaliphilum]